MTAPRARRSASHLHPDPARVLARLFLPGEEAYAAHSRVREVVERVLAMDEHSVDTLVADVLATFAHRHRNYEQLLVNHARAVATHIPDVEGLTATRTLLLRASVTAEYAVEGAALCNPSAVLHPDQRNLSDGQIRVVASLRGIGEGHVSSIGFCTAVIGPGAQWSFTPRSRRATQGSVSAALWQRDQLRAVLADGSEQDEVAVAVLSALPDLFGIPEFERTVAEAHPDLTSRGGASTALHTVRDAISSAYVVDFDPDTEMAERVIMPWAVEESNGIEDARFTRFVADDGAVDYRATYTAYDGRNITPRLLTTPDLCGFESRRLIGGGARNKGMALFPRPVHGKRLALCRIDGESTSLASSPDGVEWAAGPVIHSPSTAWESAQVGNCGPPIETERGWLVLTHGVGAMRTYSIGALLLDLNDPSRVIGRLTEPLLDPTRDEQDGYVPNVVYSCGGIVHDGLLWLPYGIGDARIGVAYVDLSELLDGLTPR